MALGSSQFDTTLWSQVLLASREPDSDGGQRALSRLCEIYRYPVYVFIRGKGASPDDAQDLTQGFFQHILSSGFFSRADPALGKFRYFLLGAVKHYLGNVREREGAGRRGGGKEIISIDATVAEQWLAAEPSAENDASKAFDRVWAMTLINNAIKQLESEQAALGKAPEFEAFKEFLQRDAKHGEYDQLALKLGTNKGAVAVAVHRLNERLGKMVRKMVRDTISDPEMAEEELRFLYSALHN